MHRFATTFTCHLVGAFVIFLNVITLAHAQQNPPTAIAVGTVAAERKAIARSGVFVGRVEAVQRVEIAVVSFGPVRVQSDFQSPDIWTTTASPDDRRHPDGCGNRAGPSNA